MSKTVKKYTQKLGAITNEEKLAEREEALRKLNEAKLRETRRLVKIGTTPPTWAFV